MRFAPIRPGARPATNMLASSSPNEGAGPVSYTHLDVYKRQHNVYVWPECQKSYHYKRIYNIIIGYSFNAANVENVARQLSNYE